MQTIVRTHDEATAFAEAKAQDDGKQAMTQEVRSLKESAKIAKQIGAKGQVFMFEKEIKRVGRAYRVRHENPYPEVTKAEAMDAMCEPIQKKTEAEKRKASGMADHMYDALKDAFNGVVATELNQLRQSQQLRGDTSNQLSNMMNAWYSKQTLASLNTPGFLSSQPGAFISVDPAAQLGATYLQYGRGLGYSEQTHKYDLACAPLMIEGTNANRSEGMSDYQAMLPMSALCRLKEAKEKDIFDSFEVWRPSEWKAPDPWLVGVHMDQGRAVYFKVCDWR